MSALTRLESSPTLQSFRREMDRFFDDFWGERWPAFFERKVAGPPIEIGETAEEIFVNAQVPGYAKENLNVLLTDDGMLTIKGDVKEEKEEKKKSYFRQEFRAESFTRTIPLPQEVDAGKARAEIAQGVLKIHVPKTEKAKQRAVTVPVS